MDIEYYVKKYKEHEAQRLSTNERNTFWKNFIQDKRNICTEHESNV